MSVPNLHSIFGMTFHTVDEVAAAVHVGGLQSQNLTANPNVMREIVDGNHFPVNAFVNGFDRQGRIASKNIDTLLDLIPVTGKCVEIDGSHPGVNFYAQKRDECGTGRASGSVHRRYLMTAGLIFPVSISCEHQQDAVFSFEAATKANGANEGIVEEDDYALPTLSTDAQNRYTLGKMMIGGVEIKGKKSLDIQYNLTINKEGADSDLEVTFVSLESMMPLVNIRGIDINWLKSTVIPRNGIKFTEADSYIYLRRRDATGTGFEDE